MSSWDEFSIHSHTQSHQRRTDFGFSTNFPIFVNKLSLSDSLSFVLPCTLQYTKLESQHCEKPLGLFHPHTLSLPLFRNFPPLVHRAVRLSRSLPQILNWRRGERGRVHVPLGSTSSSSGVSVGNRLTSVWCSSSFSASFHTIHPSSSSIRFSQCREPHLNFDFPEALSFSLSLTRSSRKSVIRVGEQGWTKRIEVTLLGVCFESFHLIFFPSLLSRSLLLPPPTLPEWWVSKARSSGSTVKGGASGVIFSV